MRRIRLSVLCLLPLLGAMATAAVSHAKVTDVHVEKTRDNVVLFVKGNETLQYKLSEFQDPPRLLITVFDQALTSNRDMIKINQGQIEKVFIKQEGEHVRVSVTLKARTQYNVFAKDGNRTVVLSMRTDDFLLDNTPAHQENPNAGKAVGATGNTGGGQPKVGANFPPPGFAYRDYQGNQPPPLPGYGFGQFQGGGDGQSAVGFDQISAFKKGIDTSPLLEQVVFQDASYSQVALQLSKMTGVNILVDGSLGDTTSSVGATATGAVTNIPGNITVDLKNVTLEQALEAITKTNPGVTWTKVGNSYAILTEDNLLAGFQGAGWGNTYFSTTQDADVRFIALKHASVASVGPYVRAIMADDGGTNVVLDFARNIVILRGTVASIQKAESVIAQLDSPVFDKPLVARLIPLPQDLRGEEDYQDLINFLRESAFLGVDGSRQSGADLTGTAGAETGGTQPGTVYRVQYMPVTGTIAYIGTAEGFFRVKELVDGFSKSNFTFKMYQFVLKNIPVTALRPTDLASALKSGVRPQTDASPLGPGDLRDASVFFDPHTNTVFYFGDKADADRLKDFLAKVDTAEAKTTTLTLKLKNLRTPFLGVGGEDTCSHPLACEMSSPYYGRVNFGGAAASTFLDYAADRDSRFQEHVSVSFFHDRNTVSITGPQIFVNRVRDAFLRADAETSAEETSSLTRMKYVYPTDAGSYISAVMTKGVGVTCGRSGSGGTDQGKAPPSNLDEKAAENDIVVDDIQLIPGNLGAHAIPSAVCLQWVANNRKGTLLIKGPASAVRDAKNLVADFDKPVPMVKLDVKVLELRTAETDILRSTLGINYGDGLLTSTITGPISAILSSASSTNNSLQIEAQNKKVNARILANPSILTSHNENTNFNFLDAVPLPVTQSGEPSTTDVGISLDVTPFIHDETEVTLFIRPQITILQGFEPGETCITAAGTAGGVGTVDCRPTQIPITNQRNLQTRVRVRNQVPLIIGGLISSRDVTNTNKIPILGDLPIFGSFFRNVQKDKEDREVVIIVTPSIMMGEEVTRLPVDEGIGTGTP